MAKGLPALNQRLSQTTSLFHALIHLTPVTPPASCIAHDRLSLTHTQDNPPSWLSSSLSSLFTSLYQALPLSRLTTPWRTHVLHVLHDIYRNVCITLKRILRQRHQRVQERLKFRRDSCIGKVQVQEPIKKVVHVYIDEWNK